jgi:hypothetical protein
MPKMILPFIDPVGVAAQTGQGNCVLEVHHDMRGCQEQLKLSHSFRRNTANNSCA